MNYNEKLLIVEDHFIHEGLGLLVVPSIDIPKADGNFKSFSTEIMISRPDQSKFISIAHFELGHLKLQNGNGKWDITVVLLDETKKTVPIGSVLFVTAEDKERLFEEVT